MLDILTHRESGGENTLMDNGQNPDQCQSQKNMEQLRLKLKMMKYMEKKLWNKNKGVRRMKLKKEVIILKRKNERIMEVWRKRFGRWTQVDYIIGDIRQAVADLMGSNFDVKVRG